jgi:hypothetical protein
MVDGGCDEELVGPGWFDSSRELQRGLLVMEGLPDDIELKLWLQFIQSGAVAEPALQPA